MPDDSRIPYALHLSAGTNTDAGTVIVENLSQSVSDTNPIGNKLILDLDTNNLKASADLANLTNNYSNNNVILASVTGVRSGNVRHIVNTTKGGVDLAFTETGADYAGASVSL